MARAFLTEAADVARREVRRRQKTDRKPRASRGDDDSNFEELGS